MASKRCLRRKSCEGKVRHPTKEGAIISLKKLTKSRGHQGYMHAYRCNFCGQWHIGHVAGRNGIGSGYM